MWQDYLFSIGSLALCAGLVPTLRSVHKPAVSTSIINALTLTAFAVAYVSLHLLISATVTAVTASLWAALATQKVQTNGTCK